MIERKGLEHDRTINFFKPQKEAKKTARQFRSRKSIPKVSARRKEEGKVYLAKRKVFLAENPVCQIQWDEKCSGVAEHVHHTKFRGRYYLDVSTWKSSCPHCHRLATDNGKEAEKRGHVIREYEKHS